MRLESRLAARLGKGDECGESPLSRSVKGHSRVVKHDP